MSFIYYKRKNGYSALNLNQIKELYVIELDSNTLELWADNIKIHTLSKYTLNECLKCDNNLKNFYYNKEIRAILPGENGRILASLNIEDFCYYLNKVSVDFIYSIFVKYYSIACINMYKMKGVNLMFEDNKINIPTLCFNLINAITTLANIDQDKIRKERENNKN